MTEAETLADINKLDAVVAELGIQDSFIEPVDALRRAIQQARSQAIDDCIKVVREKRDEYGYAKQGHYWDLYEHMASRLEALKQ